LRGDFVSVGVIALLTEVPVSVERPDPHPRCLHEVFFKAQFADWAAIVRIRYPLICFLTNWKVVLK
jgi:hypothetical protein